jgi:hypothetical protein
MKFEQFRILSSNLHPKRWNGEISLILALYDEINTGNWFGKALRSTKYKPPNDNRGIFPLYPLN